MPQVSIILVRALLVCATAAAQASSAQAPTGAAATSRTAEPATAADELVRATADTLSALRQGGLVIVLAHGQTAPDEQDARTPTPGDCAFERSLTDTGRLMASGIGKLLARERVRVGLIAASGYCRAAETADRIAAPMIPRPDVRRVDALDDAAAAPGSGAARTDRASVLRQWASTAPAPGTNTVVVTHRANIAEAFDRDIATVHAGEWFVFEPVRGAGPAAVRLVHRVTVESLSAYARVATR